jgi:hypothetical protein
MPVVIETPCDYKATLKAESYFTSRFARNDLPVFIGPTIETGASFIEDGSEDKNVIASLVTVICPLL